MTVATVPLEIKVASTGSDTYAGQWVPLVVLLTRPREHTNAVRITHISTRDAALHDAR